MRYCLYVDYCMSTTGISWGLKREAVVVVVVVVAVAVVTVFEGARSEERKLKRIELSQELKTA